jgi:hypothetical protein
VVVWDEHPLLAGDVDQAGLACCGAHAFAASIAERARRAGVVQHAQYPPVFEGAPDQLPFVGPGADPSRKGQVRIGERLDHGPCRAGSSESSEQVADRSAHRGIRVQDDVVDRVVDETHGQALFALATAGLGQLPAAQTGLE